MKHEVFCEEKTEIVQHVSKNTVETLLTKYIKCGHSVVAVLASYIYIYMGRAVALKGSSFLVVFKPGIASNRKRLYCNADYLSLDTS